MKLKLVAEPTFKAKVGIPVAGGGVVDIEFTFKHRTRKQRVEWAESLAGKSEAELMLSVVDGWEFEEPLTPENVETLLDNYSGAMDAIWNKYLEELSGARIKNSAP